MLKVLFTGRLVVCWKFGWKHVQLLLHDPTDCVGYKTTSFVRQPLHTVARAAPVWGCTELKVDHMSGWEFSPFCFLFLSCTTVWSGGWIIPKLSKGRGEKTVLFRRWRGKEACWRLVCGTQCFWSKAGDLVSRQESITPLMIITIYYTPHSSFQDTTL